MSEESNPKQETDIESSLKSPLVPVVSETEMEQMAMEEKPAGTPVWRLLIAPAWFLLGVLVGLGIFAAYTQYTAVAPIPPLSAAQVKQASRDGFMQALQEMQAQQSSGGGAQGPQAVDKNAFAVRDANLMGNPGAKVAIVEYADFQCPFCARHHQVVFPGIVQEYIDTGKASYAYKHLAFLGPESVYSAVAAECAADQSKFWEFHNYLFEHQQGENQGAFNKDKLVGFAKELNLDMTKFEPCLTNDATVARVQADTEEAQKFGVGSTPSFFVNGKPLVGLKSPDEFKAAIEAALAE